MFDITKDLYDGLVDISEVGESEDKDNKRDLSD